MTSRVRVSILALALAVFVALPAVAAAQTEVGVKVGVNMAKLSFEEDEDIKSLLGITGGVYLAKNIQNSFGFRLEGLFSQEGAKEDSGGDVFKLKLTNVNIPVLATFSPSSTGDTSFNFFAGPQVALNTSAKVEFEGDSEDLDDVKGTGFAVVVGVGVKKGKGSLDVRYVHGLTNVFEDGDSVKNRTLTAMVGWQLK